VSPDFDLISFQEFNAEDRKKFRRNEKDILKSVHPAASQWVIFARTPARFFFFEFLRLTLFLSLRIMRNL